jgi:hypothetical protein
MTLLIILCITVFCYSALALGEASTGDGSGGGKGNAVAILKTCPIQNADNVPIDSTIIFGFNKNVVHFSVNENNRTCFSMTDSTGNAVSFTVVMADDQVEPEKRRDISIKPTSSLKAGTSYSVLVSKDILSKSGDTMSDSYTLTFTTAADKAQTPKKVEAPPAPAASPSANSNKVTPPASLTSKPASSTQPKPQAQNPSSKTSPENGTASEDAVFSEDVAIAEDPILSNDTVTDNKPKGHSLIFVGTVILLVIALVAFYLFKKHK